MGYERRALRVSFVTRECLRYGPHRCFIESDRCVRHIELFCCLHVNTNALFRHDNPHPDNYKIKLGVYDESKTNEPGEVFSLVDSSMLSRLSSEESVLSQVEEVHFHPKYNPNTVEWDISLLKVCIPHSKIACKSLFPVENTRQIHRSHLARLFASDRLARYQLQRHGVGDWLG